MASLVYEREIGGVERYRVGCPGRGHGAGLELTGT